MGTLIAAAGLAMATDNLADTATMSNDFGTFEAVVTEDLLLIGSSAQDVGLRDRYGVVLVAIRRLGRRLSQRVPFQCSEKDAYQHVEWPILILLGALIPVSGALQHTGATDLMAGWLSQAAELLPPLVR